MKNAVNGKQPAGLSSAEAEKRLRQYGPNRISGDGTRSFLATLKEILTEPMLLLLCSAAGVYLSIGDRAEGMLLGAFAVMTIGLVVYQERRSENALAALRALGAPHARVMRDGDEKVIPASDIVPGDLVRLDEGERIPADGFVLAQSGLMVDESLLTGESVPVRKLAITGEPPDGSGNPPPGGDDLPYVYSGTLAVGGHGLARIVATGPATAAGRIGVSLASIVIERTRLQESVSAIVRLFGFLALIICGSLVLWYGLARQEWVEGLLSGIALAMAMLPEEFPVALAVFMAIGAWRLSQIKVLARRPAVVEMLGAATVLCVDKTGTLTENRMKVRMLAINGREIDLAGDEALPKRFSALVTSAWLAARHGSFDPMDVAVGTLADRTAPELLDIYRNWPIVREYGITANRLAFSQVWQAGNGNYLVATKGAPETIADLCHLSPSQTKKILKETDKLAKRGYRVLAVATGESRAKRLPDDPHRFSFSLSGLLAFEDPVRHTVPDAVRAAMSAGMSVKMITGDFPATAMAIARDAGIANSGEVLTGAQVERMTMAQLRKAVARYNVYARMMPEQKLKLVEALKDNDEVVAMTGDGVNDAPALKAAHIGIAMGQRGTDVAREAAGIVLQNEDFGTILHTVEQGRRIFDNLRKVMIYISAVHVPIAGLTLLPLLAGMPPLLLPMHVVLIELLIDPMCSVAFETTPAEPDLMKTPPRPAREVLVGVGQVGMGLAQGAVLLAFSFAYYWMLIRDGADDGVARALAFIALTAGNVGLSRVNGSRGLAVTHLFASGYRSYLAVSSMAALVTGVCIGVPSLRDLFGFAVPDLGDVLVAVGIGLSAALVADIAKLLPVVGRIMGGRG